MLTKVSAIVKFLLGPERAEKIKIFAGDVVPRKKPDPVSLHPPDVNFSIVVFDLSKFAYRTSLKSMHHRSPIN